MLVSNCLRARFLIAISVLVLIGSALVPHFAYAADLQNANAETYEADSEYQEISPSKEYIVVGGEEGIRIDEPTFYILCAGIAYVGILATLFLIVVILKRCLKASDERTNHGDTL